MDLIKSLNKVRLLMELGKGRGASYNFNPSKVVDIVEIDGGYVIYYEKWGNTGKWDTYFKVQGD